MDTSRISCTSTLSDILVNGTSLQESYTERNITVHSVKSSNAAKWYTVGISKVEMSFLKKDLSNIREQLENIENRIRQVERDNKGS